jgi:hypothetical protein
MVAGDVRVDKTLIFSQNTNLRQAIGALRLMGVFSAPGVLGSEVGVSRFMLIEPGVGARPALTVTSAAGMAMGGGSGSGRAARSIETSGAT